MKKLILFLFLNSVYSFGQSPISFTVFLNALPTCSTCCDGGLCVTSPSGGCNGPYTANWSMSYTGPASCSPGIYCYNTTYTVCVYDNCDTTCKVFTFPAFTGIEELSANSSFFIYPNPANDFLIIGSKNFQASFVEAIFIDLLGNKIPVSVKQDKINTSTLASGRYILQIKSETGAFYHFKFLKE